MLRYSMAKAAKRPNGTKVTLPPVPPRLAAEREYLAALRAISTAAAQEVREGIIPLYRADLAAERAQRGYMGDTARESWFFRLRALIASLQGQATGTVRTILDLEAKRHTRGFLAAAKRALGIDLAAVVAQEDLADYLETAVARNVSQITNFGDDVLKRIERSVYDNSVSGGTVKTLREQLQQQFGISERRAQLIARTETSKFNSELNRVRQEQAGVSEYVYMTSHDERVRALHRSYDGKTFKWDSPPADGHPGMAPNCRCVARGVVEF
jgi:SPP1 gp7 family putative phage head morphogenesis protein